MKDIENKLFALFDFQRFEHDETLDSMIHETKEKFEDLMVLDDTELSFALGGVKPEEKKKKVFDDEE